MKEYKLPIGWAIFIYVVATIMLALFFWLLMAPFVPEFNDGMNVDAYWFLIPMSLAMIAFLIFAIMDTYKGKFVIDKNKIYTIGAFSNRELLFNEIKGYRIRDKFIFIEAKSEHKKRIKINIYYGKVGEIKVWLANNYSDLDIAEAAQEKEEILKNQEFGSNTKQREEKLTEAKKTAKVTNIIGGAIAAWTLFFPNPYEYAILASILFPVICIIVLKYYKGLIRLDAKKDTAYPTIFLAIFATSIALCLRTLLDFSIFDYSKIWTPSLLITLAFIAALTIGDNEFKFEKAKEFWVIITLLVLTFGYSYATVVSLNCIYDKSKPEVFNATILAKRVTTGKTTTYYFDLTPWGSQKEGDDVTVSKDLYNRLNEKDKVTIYFMKGQFDIPWFEVTE